MRMQKEKLLEWLQNPITLLQKEVMQERVMDALENLARATNERDYDVFMKGMVFAYREILDWTPETTEEETDGNIQPEESGTQDSTQTPH
jgi:hypothetical protein